MLTRTVTLQMATTGFTACSAIYALDTIGKVRHGESVLIRSDSPEFAVTAYRVAAFYGGIPTIDTTEGVAGILHDLGIPRSDISTGKVYHSTSFDVVVTEGDISGDIKEDMVAPLGRVIRLCKSSDKPGNRSWKKKNISLAWVDMETVAHAKPSIMAELMSQAGVMAYRGALKPYPAKVFRLPDVQTAFTAAGSQPSSSSAVLDLDLGDSEATVPVSFPSFFFFLFFSFSFFFSYFLFLLEKTSANRGFSSAGAHPRQFHSMATLRICW